MLFRSFPVGFNHYEITLLGERPDCWPTAHCTLCAHQPAQALSKLDAGVAERVLLLSPDEATLLVVSYGYASLILRGPCCRVIIRIYL